MNGVNRLNAKARDLKQGAIRAMFDKARTMDNVISMGIGEPDLDTPAPIVDACAEALKNGFTHYPPNAGLPMLREAVSKYGLPEPGLYSPNEIMVTNGAMNALSLLMNILIEPGDHIMIQDPQWLNYAAQIEFCGGVCDKVPTDPEQGFALKAETIRKYYIPGKTKALLMNSPNNPTGHVMTLEDLQEIADLAKELDLLILSDEVYNTLIFEDAQPISIATLPGMKERTVIINSFSKSYAMCGWRVGFAAGPEGIIDRMAKAQENFNSGVNAAAQVAAAYALEHRELTVGLRETFRARREVAIAELKKIPGMRFSEPKGAFYLFPDVRAFGLDSKTFCDRLLEEEHVVCIPGSAFGKVGEGYIRIAYTATIEDIIEAMGRIKNFCARLQSK